MRKVFIAGATSAEATEQCPWAVAIIDVEGGRLCFESWDDFTIWCKQN